MEASVFLGGGWLDGSNAAVQLSPADGAHPSDSHEAGFSPADAAAHNPMHPGVRRPACLSTVFHVSIMQAARKSAVLQGGAAFC
jgi:hypothetical protein